MKPSSSSKAIASPGRALVEKFPPPLMRFLRSSVGSRSTRSVKSKGKSKAKASPLFFRRKKAAGDTAPEPSSPKVTCIGQVRVRRSKKSSHSRRRLENTKSNRCRSGCKCMRCCPISFSTKRLRLALGKWVRFWCCRSTKFRTVSPRKESNPVEENESGEEEEERGSGREVEESKELGGLALESTPPKNALLLTRCRSAPYAYRSSSLACRFCVEEEEERETEQLAQISTDERAAQTASGTEPPCHSPGGNLEENPNSNPNPNRSPKLKPKPKPEPPLLVMMRCRSEPVRRGSEKLDPLTAEFWKERRLSDSGREQ